MTVQHYALDGWNPHLAGNTGTSNWNVWADLGGNNTFLMRYLRGHIVDQLFTRTDAVSNAYGELTDRQGSVGIVIDHTGTVKNQIYYDGFGNIIAGMETDPTYRGRYAYTGRELDTEPG